MRLHEILAHIIEKEHASQLRAVPAAVVEHVLKLGVQTLSLRVAGMRIDADDLTDREWERCEGCDNFGRQETLHRHADEEGDVLLFCGACHEEQIHGDSSPFGPEAA